MASNYRDGVLRICLAKILAGLTLAMSINDLGAAYPEKPIKFVVPFPPGGGAAEIGKWATIVKASGAKAD